MRRRTEIVSVPDPDLDGRNRHEVPLKQWRKWSSLARQVFNYTFAGLASQKIVVHPHMPLLERAHWRTVRWNAAWTAADAIKKAGL